MALVSDIFVKNISIYEKVDSGFPREEHQPEREDATLVYVTHENRKGY